MVILNNTNCIFEYTDGMKYLVTTRFLTPEGYFETKVFDANDALHKPITASTRWTFLYIEASVNHKKMLSKYNCKPRGKRARLWKLN